MIPNFAYWILFILLGITLGSSIAAEDWAWVAWLSFLLLVNFWVYYRNNQIKEENNSGE